MARGLKRIGLDQRKTLKAVCLDAFDAYIAKHTWPTLMPISSISYY